jgi:hypothetical protein
MTALCSKHAGFEEEREWRLTYQPSMHPSNMLVKERHSIRGIPQVIYKVPLEEPPTGLVGLSLAKFIHKIIIGPTEVPGPIYTVFYELLAEAGVANPSERIVVSDIPLRK